MSEWAKKYDVMRRYDLTAHLYDMRYAEEQIAKIEAAVESVQIEGHGSVLDVGCGTGLLSIYIANKAKMIVGLDISRKTLLQAKKRTKTSTNAHLILADADNMPLKENAFNHVFALTLIQNTPSPLETLAEIKRVAEENAMIIITGLKKKFSIEAFKELLQDADLNVIALKHENLNCYVAVCTKVLH